jgi:Tfp pilus assembly protein PilV
MIKAFLKISILRPKSPRRGLSLVETTMAGFVIALAVIFVANLIPTTMLALRSSETRTQANLLAQSLLEGMRSVPFSRLAAIPAGQVKSDNVILSYQSFVEDVTDADPKFLKRIRVEVTWTIRSKERRVSREALVHPVRR